jgi:hypothetical protein
MKNRLKQIFFVWFLLFIISIIVGSAFGGHYSLFIIPAFADIETTSTNYKIKTPTLDEAGESKSSTNYKLGDSVAQTVQGEITSTNYKVYAGFQYYGEALLVLSISCDSTVNIPPVTPGTPQSANNNCTVTTNSTSGYTLYTWEGSDLTRTSPPAQTISAANLGSYSAPIPWSDGVSVGLGFSLSGPTTEVKWATGSNFASFVTQSAAANTYSSSLSEGSTSLISLLKLDTTTAQLTGAYQNEVYYYVTGSIL